MKAKNFIQEDLIIQVGVGATYTIGSDSYPYYVSEVLPRGVIGLYSPAAHFANSWVDGCMKVDDFDASHQTEVYIKRRYGKWWKVTKDGKPIEHFVHLHFGQACSYRDPSF